MLSDRRIMLIFGLAASVAASVAAYFHLHRSSAGLTSAIVLTVEPHPQPLPRLTDSVKFAVGKALNPRKLVPAAKIGLLTNFPALSEREQSEFKVVSEQVNRYLIWGEMDASEVDDFRNALFHLADRGVAQYARELNDASRDNVFTEETANAALRKVDTITYLARYGIPAGLDAIKALATRSVDWDENGKAVDAVRMQITMESFQSLASIDAGAAQEVLHTLDARSAPAYSYSYILGRRMAQESDVTAIQVIRTTFDEDLVNYLKSKKFL